ncbi:hypothetical protein FGADI_2178 [Fusarium gaditjirri]|uniref:CHAT domain-containing protein n=1 Tax=Fusarium gaditjirri TaxID=282569 RepID=A0A8H4X2M8_9HYPO|nr:hypothetical protein FGADI_2178 [Fusarium gaditjirri]
MQRRYQMTEDLEDLDEAIRLTQQALFALGPSHPQQADTMSLIALFFAKRYGETESPEDLQRTEFFYRAALFQTQSPVVTRIEAGVKLISVCMVQQNMEQAYEDAKCVVDFIPQITVRSLESSDKKDLLLKIGGVSSEAAGLALHLGEDPLVALNLLEKGRGIFALSLDEIRADIKSLEEQYPDLARKFIILREQLFASSSSRKILNSEDPEWNVDDSRRHEAGDEFEKLLTEILENHQITSVPLLKFNRRDMIDYANNGTFRSDEAIQWFWDGVAGPVLDALGIDKPPAEGDWPHVWWIMTGLLNKFPIHAAGHHSKDSSETVIGNVISSYHSSIRSIIRGRKRHRSAETQTNALLVAMESTPGSSKLSFATREIAAIRGLCVIGTLWEVKDEICVDMARITYEGMMQNGMTDDSVSRGLHEASRELRDRWLTMAGTHRTTGSLQAREGESERGGGEELEGKGLDGLWRDIVTCDEEPVYPPWIPYIHYGV